MADGTRKSTGQSLRPRRTERAHRGKPDFYSPSDYENPFKRQRRRTSSSETDIMKKKGRPRNSLKTLKFESSKQEQKNEDDSSRDNDEGSTDSSRRSGYEEKQSESPVPRKLERERREIKPTTKAKIINSIAVHRPSKPIHTSVHKPSKSLNLCSDMAHIKSKEMTLMKDVVNSKEKDKDRGDGKEPSSAPAKQTDLHASLTSEKSLQCAIILAEINKKFICQNFKPS